jgi:hypothetical protein
VDDVDELGQRRGFNLIPEDETDPHGCAVRHRSERCNSLFVLQANNNTEKIGEVFSINPTVFHVSSK